MGEIAEGGLWAIDKSGVKSAMDEPTDLLTKLDEAAATILAKAIASDKLDEQVEGFKLACSWLERRAKLSPPPQPKGGGKFDQLRDQFHNGGTSRRRGAAAKAANGAAADDDGAEPASDA